MNPVQINTQDLFFKEINNRICTVVGTYKHSRFNKDCIVVGHSRFLLWDRSGSHSKASLLSNPEFKLITNDFEYGAIFPKTYFHKIDYRIWISWHHMTFARNMDVYRGYLL